MPVLTDWTIDIHIDHIFAIQNVDGEKLRARNPKLFDITGIAIEEALTLLRPQVTFKDLAISEILPHDVLLDGGKYRLSSGTLAEQFSGGEVVTAAVCTIGNLLEQRASQAMQKNQHAHGYVFDSTGTAALEQVGSAFYDHYARKANLENRHISHRFSPGLGDWPVTHGQPEIFRILQNEPMSVELTSSYQMRPLKSLSFVFAVGKDIVRHGKACDYCSMRESCDFRFHHERESVCKRSPENS
jgi:hypothetical protein